MVTSEHTVESPICSMHHPVPPALFLAVIGTVLVLLSLVVLAYAVWPGSTTREQYRLSPTVFVQPQ